MTRERIHCIRFTDSEWEAIHERAVRCGMAFGAYMRSVSLGSIPRQRRQLREDILIQHLARLGNNLNQIARRLNTGLPVAECEIRDGIRRINELLEKF